MRSRPGPVRNAAPLVGLWIAVAVYYVFVVSAGTFTQWHGWSSFYDAQATALLNGHLHLLEKPSRALTALKDPYDVANMNHWRWDHSYYRGHLYLYWGMVPAFLAAAAKVVVGGGIHVPDVTLTFWFAILRLVAGTLLIRAVARRATPPPPRWAVALAMLVFTLANPMPHTLARAAIYEAAIMGGVAFMLVGLWLGHWSLQVPGRRAAAALVAGASLAFALAGGSRLNLMPVGAALALLLALPHWQRARAEGDRRRAIGTAAAALAPAGAVTLALLAINQLRFGAWAEFGRRYVMTYPRLFLSPRFLLPDVYAYAFAPLHAHCAFPFLSSAWYAVRVSTPGWLPVTWPLDLYAAEPTIGLLVAAPFACLALAAPLFAIARWRLRRVMAAVTPTSASTSASPSPSPPRSRLGWLTPERWLPAALAVWLLGASPLLLMNMISMRYEHDFASVLMLVAIFGGWRLLAAPSSTAARRATASLYGLLAAATITAGVLLGFGGYFDHFERHNPALFYTLQQHLNVCARD